MSGILTDVPLVTAEWLAQNLDRVVVVDCRWKLGEPGAGRLVYEEAHIPGAAHLDVDRHLSAPPGHGRHPLPDPQSFATAAARAGIGARSRVVAYDEGNGGAARLWWLLRHFGHPPAAVLDGGFGAWEGPLARGTEVPPPPAERFVALPRDDDTVTAEEIARGGLDLVDARAPERYRGEREPVDPVAGHIPGARNVPFTQPLEAVGSQLSDGAVAYCGSGVTAATLVLAGQAAGLRIRLYPGGWSEWSGRGLPVETGDPS
jgi:thiosulfate/3-mercaptopyruvate sulfurtransferase